MFEGGEVWADCHILRFFKKNLKFSGFSRFKNLPYLKL